MIEHLEERRRFSKLYCPTGEYEEHIKEEIVAIEKKLGGGGNVEVWLRDPADRSVFFSAISDLPIRYEDEFVVIFRSELEALEKRARDVVIDQLKSLPKKE
jgi:hypothetical protein